MAFQFRLHDEEETPEERQRAPLTSGTVFMPHSGLTAPIHGGEARFYRPECEKSFTPEKSWR